MNKSGNHEQVNELFSLLDINDGYYDFLRVKAFIQAKDTGSRGVI
jgi:hypothetical protein